MYEMATVSLVALALLLAVGLVVPEVEAAIINDLKAEWTTSSNPNGVWTYREGANALPSVANWILPGLNAAQPAWAPSIINGNFLPGWVQSPIDNPGGLDILAGDVVVHSTDVGNGSVNGVANVIWTSPFAGTINISGSVWMTRDIGRSNNWTLSKNAISISSGNIFSGDSFNRANPFNFSSGSGGPAALQTISVLSGDMIQLAIERTSIPGDFVGVNLTIESVVAPSPSALILMGSGLLSLIGWRWWKGRLA